MKNILFLVLFAFTVSGFAQYKNSDKPSTNVYDSILKPESPSLFGFLNSDNFQMHHSFEMSFATTGSQSLSLGSYTNSIFYKFSNKLNFQLSTSIVTSPYSSLGSKFQKSINGVYINRAAINFKPWKNVDVSLEYRQLPAGMSYYSPYSYYGNDGMWGSGFYNSDSWDNDTNNQ